MKNILIFLLVLLTPTMALAKDERPNVFGIKLGSDIRQAEKSCRRQGGDWFASKLNVFSCRTEKFNASIEADSRDNVVAVAVSFKNVKFYNEQLKKFILKYNDICATQKGANKTLIHECGNNAWVVNFMSYGRNGNYTVYLYSIKEILAK